VPVWTVQPSGFVAVQMTFVEDRRVLVISWLFGGRMTWAEAAELGGVSVATVGRWYRVFRRTGAFWPDDALGQQHYNNAVFNPNFLVAVTSLIVDSPEAFLGEISETLRQLSELPGWEGLPHSPSTVSLVLRAVGYTHKRQSRTSASAVHIADASSRKRYAACPSSASSAWTRCTRTVQQAIVGTAGRCAVCEMRS